jgi:hypothetical protein
MKSTIKPYLVLILLLSVLDARSQNDSTASVFVGAGIQGRVQGTYFTELWVRPIEKIQLHAIYGKTTVRANINNFDNAKVSGTYWGAGISGVFFQGEKLFPNFRKSPTTAVSIGARYMLGDMDFEADRTITSSAYEDFVIDIKAENLRFIYIEFFATIEIMIANRIKLDLTPIMVKHAQVESFEEATVRYNPLGGRSAMLRPSLGIGLSYYFGIKTKHH